LARLCARALATASSRLGGRFRAEEKLRAILEPAIWDELGDLWETDAEPIDDLSRADEWIESEHRSSGGVFFTPSDLAQSMAELATELNPTHVVDPSCGAAELLLAADRVLGPEHLTGVERHAFLALIAALRLADANASATIVWGDGLSYTDDSVDLVISNPPYVGEKGRKALFDAIRKAHPQWEDRFSARMDLAYLFMHHALDLADAVVLLTSEYWLMADSSRGLRAEMAGHEPLTFYRLGRGVFDSARGHHSLVTTVGFEPFGELGLESGAIQKADDRPWFPFASKSEADWDRFPRLEEHLRDQQGFVSGLDRATGRHPELDRGTPYFVAERHEIDAGQEHGAGWWRPLIRARDCAPNLIFVEPPSNDYVLWLDGDVEVREPLQRLESARQRLEARREARQGSMPWYRIHWPRNRQDQVAPKLVVPRRSREAAFCLDLSASHVSSDCTYLLAPDEISEPVEYLVRMMVSLNSSQTARYLEDFAKRKGEIIEFYSSPLKRIPLFIETDGSSFKLLDPRLEALACEIMDAL